MRVTSKPKKKKRQNELLINKGKEKNLPTKARVLLPFTTTITLQPHPCFFALTFELKIHIN
jgi:hypothetical protein